METIYINILFAGFAGGIVRGIVGFIKHQFQFKNAIFKPKYFFGMMALSGIVGLLTALAVKGSGLPVLGGTINPALAFIVGYAGGDFIENIYKMIVGKTTLY